MGLPATLSPAAPLALLNPGLLWLGAGLISVPILIHLFNRRRVRRQPWAAMQWLLAAMKKHPEPATLVMSNYVAVLDSDECSGCETCVERCQMDALVMDESGVCDLTVERCIGCGLCVTTCPSGALTLHPKPQELQRVPPETTRDQMMAMARKRGVL